MDLFIRTMQDAELEAVVRMWWRTKRDAFPWLPTEQAYTYAQNLEYFRDVVCTKATVWVAEDGGRVVGLLALGDRFVEQLHVDTEWQGKGVGSALLQHAKALSPEGLSLFTLQKNEGARGFYERRGFRAVAFGVSPAPESEPDVRYAWSP